MSAPPKPWERAGDVNQRQPNYQPEMNPSFMPSSPHMMPGPGGGGGMPGPGPGHAMRPPIPPRPTTSPESVPFRRAVYGGYSGYGGGYGGYGALGTGMYGGAYNRGYGMNGYPDVTSESGFIQLAEESSRQAFQSIDSIVQAFNSISMMLDSTYQAVYNSFRAVLGVADHFNRMKSQFAQIFSALAVVRTLRWMYRKLLFLIGLRSQDPSMEAAWRNTASSLLNGSQMQITEADIKASKSSWPIVLFFGVVFGAPYVIWRLLSTLVTDKAKSNAWVTGNVEHYAAVAEYPFQAKTKSELSILAGQPLILAPKDRQPHYQGWVLASNGTTAGVVPINYIKILGLRAARPQKNMNQQNEGGLQQSVASRIPNIPFPQPGSPPGDLPTTGATGRNFGPQPGQPYLDPHSGQPNFQPRLLSPGQTGVVTGTVPGQPAALNTLQRQRPPVAAQHGQAPLPGTYQGHRLPISPQQAPGAPHSTQQAPGAPHSIQQAPGAQPVTQQMPPDTLQSQPVTQGASPKHSASSVSPGQQNTAEGSPPPKAMSSGNSTLMRTHDDSSCFSDFNSEGTEEPLDYTEDED